MSVCSVVIPVYNAATTIERCVCSVLSQRFEDFELILVNDGSSDDSGRICDKLARKDHRIKVIHQRNGGPSMARNAGIGMSSGKYITFIDSDDFITPEYLSSFLMKEDIDIEIQGFTLSYEKDREDQVVVPSFTSICTISELLEETELNGLVRGPVCKLFHASIIKEHNIEFLQNFNYGEDAVFVKNYLLFCAKARLISRSNYIYTHSSAESLTSRFHKGSELMDATRAEYALFNKLRQRNPIGQSTWNIFLFNKSIDFYQAVYNTIVDKDLTMQEKQSFMQNLDGELYCKIKCVKGLPPTFKIIRLVLSLFAMKNATKVLVMIFGKR